MSSKCIVVVMCVCVCQRNKIFCSSCYFLSVRDFRSEVAKSLWCAQKPFKNCKLIIVQAIVYLMASSDIASQNLYIYAGFFYFLLFVSYSSVRIP